MAIDRLSHLQDRMGRSYQEQIWAVAIVVGTNISVIGQAKLLVHILGRSYLTQGLSLICAMGMLFVLSRHIIYKHYDGLLRDLINEDPSDAQFFGLNRFGIFSRWIIGWSGVLLYLLLLLAITMASVSVVRNVCPAPPNPPLNSDPACVVFRSFSSFCFLGSAQRLGAGGAG